MLICRRLSKGVEYLVEALEAEAIAKTLAAAKSTPSNREVDLPDRDCGAEATPSGKISTLIKPEPDVGTISAPASIHLHHRVPVERNGNEKAVVSQRTTLSTATSGGRVEVGAISTISDSAAMVASLIVLPVLLLLRVPSAVVFSMSPNLLPSVSKCLMAIVHRAFETTLSWLDDEEVTTVVLSLDHIWGIQDILSIKSHWYQLAGMTMLKIRVLMEDDTLQAENVECPTDSVVWVVDMVVVVVDLVVQVVEIMVSVYVVVREVSFSVGCLRTMGIDDWQEVSRKNNRYRTKEDDVIKISISIYVSNFPESFSAKDLFHACSKYGHVVDSFIPSKRSKEGKRFGFVRFINVFSAERSHNQDSLGARAGAKQPELYLIRA
ncbi:nucleotide-binding alpha-beta plait domain-containing protein [Tanacetum coccineum]